MKKILLVQIILFLVNWNVYSQIKWENYSQSYGSSLDTSIVIITAISALNNSFWVDETAKSVHYMQVQQDAQFQLNRPKNISVLSTYDTNKVYFVVHGINPVNAREFQFRVVKNLDSIVVPWSDITNFTPAGPIFGTESGPLAFIGGFKSTIDNNLTIDIRHRGDSKIVTYSTVFWDKLQPVLLNIYTSDELGDFLKRQRNPWPYVLDKEEIAKWESLYSKNLIDSVTHLPKKLILPSRNNSVIFCLKADIYKKEQVEYQVVKDGKTFVSWRPNDFDGGFIWLKNLPPGNFTLKVRYKVQRENEFIYHFEVKPAWYQTNAFYLISGSLIATFFAFLVIAYMFYSQRRQLRKEQLNIKQYQVELKSLYAQLNPHFVFNALNSIQGLINANKIAAANMYLSMFGKIMRDSMENHRKDLISLKKEIDTLEVYLKLEQLRFGFGYNLSVDDTINVNEVEFPPLMVQPIIENSIKHGVYNMSAEGIIDVTFDRDGDDLIVLVKDNGVGFATLERNDSYGLMLVEERIRLLNQIAGKKLATFKIQNGPNMGVSCVLVLKEWIAQ